MHSQPDGVLAEPEQLPWYYRRNALAFGADMALFHGAISFIGSTTVLPTFLAALTDSEIVVGLVGGISGAAWLLPQMLIAGLTARQARKKPMVIRAVWLTRPVLLLMALMVWLFGDGAPMLTLGVTMLGITVFFVGDAFAAVPWFDLVAKALPFRRRGRVLGLGQILGGVLGIGAGAVVHWALGPTSPWTFPQDYAVLFAIGGGVFVVASLVLSWIHEPESQAPTAQAQPLRQVLASIPSILGKDRAFQRVMIVRLLAGLMGVASAFYVLYATRHLGFDMADAGMFLSAQVAGSMGAGVLLSLAQDRWGPVVHMRIVIAAAILPPALTLLAAPLQAVAPGSVYPLYMLVFFLFGLYAGGLGWPFFNWILEHAKGDQSALYIGLSNTLSALAMVAPVIGGWTVRAVSYPAVFALSLALGLAALVLSATIRDTRKATG